MGWKSSTIIINSDKIIDENQLLNDLGFHKLVAIENEPFEVAIYPKGEKIYIGTYKGNTIICTANLPHIFLEKTISKEEKILSQYYPDIEICALVLHSAINLWGYSISKNGEKIRVRTGSAETGTIVDYGNPLNEEKELLSKSSINNEGNRIYRFDYAPDEIYEEDQVGEEFVFELGKRYFGKKLDADDELLFETELKGFRFERMEEIIIPNQTHSEKEKTAPWWRKYFIIIFVVLAWQIIKRIF